MDFKDSIQQALREDVGDGDHTSLACISESEIRSAQLLVKQDGVVAGIFAALEVFRQVDPSLDIKLMKNDGDKIAIGDIILTIQGSARNILTAERLALNYLQRMSGIATYTAHLCSIIEGTGCKLLDTRKTTPGMRFFEKEAVRLGGGVNHRYGLYDMIMIKDNHVDYAGSIPKAIEAVKRYLNEKKLELDIIVEARNEDEVRAIVEAGGVRRILLDNFTPEAMAKVIQTIPDQFETEASGGINEQTIRSYAETGVDYISVGALTHQIKSLDLSLKAKL